jgi:hypothetical protein
LGRQQIALTRAGGALEAPARKLKLTDVLEDVDKTTEALAQGLGRSTGEKRKTPSKRLRDAVSECAGSFNAVHEEITWFLGQLPAGPDRERLTAVLEQLNALLARNAMAGQTDAPGKTETPETPETKEG